MKTSDLCGAMEEAVPHCFPQNLTAVLLIQSFKCVLFCNSIQLCVNQHHWLFFFFLSVCFLQKGNWLLSLIHRSSNTDFRLASVFDGLGSTLNNQLTFCSKFHVVAYTSALNLNVNLTYDNKTLKRCIISWRLLTSVTSMTLMAASWPVLTCRPWRKKERRGKMRGGWILPRCSVHDIIHQSRWLLFNHERLNQRTIKCTVNDNGIFPCWGKKPKCDQFTAQIVGRNNEAFQTAVS